MERPAWAPAELDLDRPNAARMYDYYLGGSHNFAVDRELAGRVLEAWPDMPRAAQANRAFLRRAVRFLAERGVRQFLDIGSGIPTVGNVHEVAQAAAPDARVVYVDTDPVAVAHSRAILAGDAQTAVVQADGRDPAGLLVHPGRDRPARPATGRSGCSWSRCCTSSPTRATRAASWPATPPASPQAAGWSSRTPAPNAPGVRSWRSCTRRPRPDPDCAAGATGDAASPGSNWSSPGSVPAGLAAGLPGRRAGDARWASGFYGVGCSVDVNRRSRGSGRTRRPALRSPAQREPASGRWPPCRPGDQLRRDRPPRTRRLPAAASPAAGRALSRSRSAPPRRTGGRDLIAAHFTGPEISGRLVKMLGTRLLRGPRSGPPDTGPGWRRCSARPPPGTPGH